MLTRTLLVGIAALLVAGCQTSLAPMGYLAPDQRDRKPLECKKSEDCYIAADPRQQQWIAEYIRIDAQSGERFLIWLNNDGAEFDESPITWQSAEGQAAFNCSEKNRKIVKCRATDTIARGKEYKYSINVKDLKAYDPFVWTR